MIPIFWLIRCCEKKLRYNDPRMLVCDTYYKENLIKAIQILLANDFPLDLIFKTVKRRLHYLFFNKLNLVDGESN